MSGDTNPQTRSGLTKVVEDIRTKSDELKKKPGAVNDAFGRIVKGVRIAGYGGGLALGPLGPVVGGGAAEAAVHTLWQQRDRVLQIIADVDKKLGDVMKGITIPITFIDYANTWRDISSAVTEAGNQIDETKLTAQWSGIAAESYENSRLRQAKPCSQGAIPASCETIAVALEDVAVKTLELYREIVAALISMITSLAELAGIAASGPGVVAQTGEIVKALANLYGTIATAVGSIASSAQNSMINGNRIAQASSDIDGLPDNKWPAMVVSGTAKFDDATVTDGTNQWSVRTDRVTQ
ncbi:hypothetical protein ACFVMC_30180 [Nocardia sp. NPDC127579]|uniref:hypothetical protein n=1 Tax=Nocardia sp. NPDC127579 TaxID=3345402 RepID=UPI0036408DE4